MGKKKKGKYRKPNRISNKVFHVRENIMKRRKTKEKKRKRERM